MNQDEQNLSLLSLFHYILGGLTILFGCLFFIHVGTGIGMLSGRMFHNGPPASMGWIFITAGSLAILFFWTIGILMLVAGKKLKEHRSRTFCIVVAGIECIFTPLGTVLGVFTIITLTKESVIALFAANEQNAVNQ